MSKFWTVVAVIVLIGLGVLMFPGSEDKAINFTDLETECRYDRGSETAMQINQDNSLTFSGYFPAESPEAEVDYSYSKTSDSITLNVYSRGADRPENFFGTCLASVIYQGRTDPLKQGRYFVTVKHEGEVKEKKIIRIE